jgi:hypothetical protein
MNPTTSPFLAAVLAALLLATPSASRAADSLGAKMREARADRILGTWVDEDTGGEVVRVTYAWRIADHALAISFKSPHRESEALVGIDPKSGDVAHVAIDSEGGAAIGKWTGEGESAILELKRTAPDGSESTVRISQRFEGDDRLVVEMSSASGEGGSVVLVRKKD